MTPLSIDTASTPLIPETATLLRMAARIGFSVLGAFVIQRLLFLVVGRIEHWIRRAGHRSDHARQRATTVGQMLRNLITGLVGAGVLMHVLEIFGWDVRPFLAGAGILGVALGFGAQQLVRDVIAGVFIIADDQFGVGDLVEVNGRIATVEELTVRQTTLRDFNGYLLFVPNGEMKIVVNRSRDWNRLAVDVPIAAGEDVDAALGVCHQVAAQMSGDPKWKAHLLGVIEVWGVETLDPQHVSVRLVVKGKPGRDTNEAARELRRRLHIVLAEQGIRTILPREVAIHGLAPGSGDPSGPAAAIEPTPPATQNRH